jgi:S-adenosylmethionine decarboxylase proenzyme
LNQEYKFAGRQLLIDFIGCRCKILNDPQKLMKLLQQCVKKVGATPLKKMSYKFEPQGVSVIILLAESHCALYSYPEHNSAFFDFFTCGDELHPQKCIPLLLGVLQPKKFITKNFKRGKK